MEQLAHKRKFSITLLERAAGRKHLKLIVLEEHIYQKSVDGVEYLIVDIQTYNTLLSQVLRYLTVLTNDDEYVIDLYLNGEYSVDDVMNKRIVLYQIFPRQTYLSLFYAFLWTANKHLNLCDMDSIFHKAYVIELSCLKHAIEISKNTNNLHTLCITWDTTFKSIYEERCAIIARSLDIESDMYQHDCMNVFIKSVLTGTLPLAKIGKMSYLEICPDAYKAETKELETRSSQKIVEKTSRMFACPACKKRNVTYREDQRRSLDEASGFACKCIDCGLEFYKR